MRRRGDDISEGRRDWRPSGGRSRWWSGAAAVALIAGAGWLRAPDPRYLAVSLGATLIALALAFVGRAGPRSAALTLLLFEVAAASGQRTLHRIDVAWPAVAEAITTDAQTAARRSLDGLAASLRRTAERALDAPADPAAAFASLRQVLGTGRGLPELGVVLYRGDAPVAWAGTLRARPSDDRSPFSVNWSDFYVTLQASAERDGSRAVATALVHADPPADRLSRALDEQLAALTGVTGFAMTRPSGVPMTGDVFAPAGQPLFGLEPLTPHREAVRLSAIDRSRRNGAVLFALALIAFVATEWRPRSPLAWRLLALTVPILGVAIVPLNAFSNITPLFDPTYFFSSLGGPLTASIGALALTSAIAALGSLAVVRARVRLRSRPVSLVLAVSLAIATPLVVRALAEGITSPGSGVPVELWIVWQLTVALAGVALLALGLVAGRGALGSWRGVRPTVSIGLAVAATIAGIMLWQPRPSASFPAYYVVVWVVAAAAVIFSAPVRTRVVTAGIVAGCGAALLIWAANAERRVTLAERDVAGLNVPDVNAVVPLARFGADLTVAPPPRSRADLLKLYARSLLAAGGYPVALTAWSPDGDSVATLKLARFGVSAQRVAQAVAQARSTDSLVLVEAAGSPGTQLILAAPGPTHAVTTVVVGPPTRLISEDPDTRFFGVTAGTSVGTPAYSLTLIRVDPRRADTVALRAASRRWSRQGDQLHADWVVNGAFGPARAHVEIDLRTLDTLAERGTLLLLVDLLVVGFLWMLAAFAGGAFGRWFRWRARRWGRSYRGQLTVVLFAFFVAPALLFAAWSYRRLASDDRQSRALRVLETLRSIVNNGEVDLLPLAGDRLDTPVLLYRNGMLGGTSDTLFDALAPLGMFLRPDVQLGLGLAEELTADRVEPVGGTRTLFGYRAATDDRGEHVILAAPAGTDNVDDAALTRRRDDLSILLLFATAVGAVAALWLSGLAARQLARPIDALRRAALAAAAGVREPDLGGEPPAEFIPVFSAFRRMAADFGASQRVLAWGEMARQVAHEIKNPLTPIRLGVQHLQRAHADRRRDFDRILQQNASRILAEIDRLDEIARAFSRYGTAPEERAPAQPTDVGAVVRDVVELERLGADAVTWTLTADDDDGLVARARADELREVVLNLLENARLAGSRAVHVRAARNGAQITIAVEDDGEGIPDDVLPRIFEPHFSTRTSGSGLGLALSRRLVDGWGGTITVVSQRGQGTVVTVSLLASA